MTNRFRILMFTASLLACGAIMLNASDAQAKRGIVIINSGEDIDHVGDVLPAHLPALQQSTGASKPAVGYMYSEFGIFWLNIWTWDGKYVLFEGDNFWALTPEHAAGYLGVPVAKLSKPLFYTIPPGLVVILLLVIGFGVFWFVGGKDDDDEESEEDSEEAATTANS